MGAPGGCYPVAVQTRTRTAWVIVARRLWIASFVAACGRGEPQGDRAAESSGVVPATAVAPVASCLERAAALAEAPDAAVARTLCAEQRTLGIPGVAVAVAEGGTIVFGFAHGLRCIGRPEAVSITTAFRIGSITKAITAAAAFALAEAGRVDLDAGLGASTLARLGLDEALAAVTLRQLLDHRAGLPDILPNPSLRGRSRGEQLAALVGVPVDPPGTTWRYSNGGYALVGAVLGEHAAVSWSELVAREVFGPLQMRGARADADPRGDVACGHLPSGAAGETWTAFDVRQDFEQFAFGVEVAAPSGAVVATADDLLRFALSLSRAAPHAPAWSAQMLDAVTTRSSATGRHPGERYAAGLDITESNGELVLRHSGSTGDFWAELVWVPARGAAVVVLGNTGTPMAATLVAALTRIGVDPRRE